MTPISNLKKCHHLFIHHKNVEFSDTELKLKIFVSRVVFSMLNKCYTANVKNFTSKFLVFLLFLRVVNGYFLTNDSYLESIFYLPSNGAKMKFISKTFIKLSMGVQKKKK